MSEYDLYNPLDKVNLGASVADALLSGAVHPLGNLPDFVGAGIYAIYYTGGFPAYRIIAEGNRGGNFNVPIYVGKAVPPGARKGLASLDTPHGNDLSKRLKEHADSIRETTNLKVEDVHCRFLVVDDIWIPLGESLLIATFQPIWNKVVEGFGNHDPGKGRYNGMRPKWDVLHPGRSWASKCGNRPESAQQIEAKVIAYLEANPPPVHSCDTPGRSA